MGHVAQSEFIGEEADAGHLRSFDQRQMMADFVGGCRHRSATASGVEAHDQEHSEEIGGLLGDVHRAMDLTLLGRGRVAMVRGPRLTRLGERN